MRAERLPLTPYLAKGVTYRPARDVHPSPIQEVRTDTCEVASGSDERPRAESEAILRKGIRADLQTGCSPYARRLCPCRAATQRFVSPLESLITAGCLALEDLVENRHLKDFPHNYRTGIFGTTREQTQMMNSEHMRSQFGWGKLSLLRRIFQFGKKDQS